MNVLRELFSDLNLNEYLAKKKNETINIIKSLKVSQYNDYYSLAGEFASSNKINPLLLQESKIKLVSNADDYVGTSPYILIKFKIPYVGDSILFTCIPEQKPPKDPPFSIVEHDNIIITLRASVVLNPDKSRAYLQKKMSILNEYINEVNKQANHFNCWVDKEVPLLIKERYEYVQKVQQTLASFGIPTVNQGDGFLG